MKEKLKAIQEKAMAAFQEAKEMKDIDDLKVKYLGKKPSGSSRNGTSSGKRKNRRYHARQSKSRRSQTSYEHRYR